MKRFLKVIGISVVSLTLFLGGFLFFGNAGVTEGKGFVSKALGENVESKRVLVTKYGAVGDGKHNDYDAFNSAINSGASEIYVPAGTYNLGGKTVNAKAEVSLVGENQDNCVIKNGCISTKNGIAVSNITFDGGATQTINYTGGAAEEGTVILWVSPSGQQNVCYTNCTFKNATVASFAREGNGSFANDEVVGCTFLNIKKVAIYHSLNIGNATYSNNTFSNLGGSDIKTGFVSALWIGDVTNNTYVQATNTVIEKNTFSNLVTKDDFSDASHVINANFISIRSDKAVIDKNDISNLVGYGNDREAVYTKVRDLTISNNTIVDGGMGEGYICNKSQKGDAFCNIIDNTIRGDAGCGIRSYAPGTISGNTIAIANCTSVITNTRKENITNNKGLVISGNIIKCGTYPQITIGEKTISSYSTGKAIRISQVTTPITVEKNKFETTTDFDHYISVGNPGSSVTICDNTINRADKDGNGISVFSTKNGKGGSSKLKTSIERNQFISK